MPTYCPQCRAIRQPNGVFCHMCGYSYAEAAPRDTQGPSLVPHRLPGLSIGDGWRFGVGFTIATGVIGLVVAVVWLYLFTAWISLSLGGLAR